MTDSTPATAASEYVAAEIARKRETVGMASTVLDPLPQRHTADTATILQALDGAAEVLRHLYAVTGLSNRAGIAMAECERAAAVVRARIRQEAPNGD